MIHDVIIKKLKVIPDERGRLMEIFRSDDDLFEHFGQVYLTTAYPGVVKAWHYHKKQIDHMAVVQGMMKIVLYDGRKKSPTYKKIQEIFAGVYNPVLVRIPSMVYHGFKCISQEEALVINVPNQVYHYKKPDEYRLDPHKSLIKYNWGRKDG
jgi:dTDP-4-dehydrorhamnose 3,5-epimerase